jgi:hypothetical protein
VEWLSVLLGAGTAGVIGSLVQGVKMLRETASARTARAIAQMEKWKDEATQDAEYYHNLSDHWRNWAGTIEYAARQSGVVLPRKPPAPERPKRPQESVVSDG